MTSMIRSTIAAFGLMLMVAALSGTALAIDPSNAPELDPGSIGSAVTLATGALVVLRGRRAAR